MTIFARTTLSEGETVADAGWYPDAQDPNSQHYFDGQNWTGQRRPTASSPSTWPQPGAAGETVRRSDLPDPQASQWPTQQVPQEQRYPTQYPHTEQFPQTPPSQYPHTEQFAQPPAGQWQPQPPQPQPQGSWQPPQWDEPKPARRRRKTPLIIAGVAVVAVAAGLTTWLVWPDDAPSLTYQGKELASASDTLTKAETNVDAAVSERHGAKNGDTRCYFAKPKKPQSGAKKSDVEDALRCGPVLYVDGEKSAEYLRVPLTDSASGGKVTLEPPANVGSLEPSALADDIDLTRPDGKTAPEGDGGLDVPKPPAAAKNLLIATTLGSTPAPNALTDAVMVGKYTRVTVSQAGEIARYGTGDDARSAPEGQKLIAFQLRYGAGDVSSSGAGEAKFVVGSATPATIPSTTGPDSYVVAAVAASEPAQLVLTDGDLRQTIDLPDGKLGSGNIAVLRRSHRFDLISKTTSVPIRLSKGGRSVNATFKATVTIAALDFWPPGNTSIHASNPGRAILSVRLTYTESADPGKTFGFEPGLVRMKLRDGTYVKARNIAPKGKILNVFDVPADFTTGSLQITGSAKIGAFTVRVRSTKTFEVRIASG